MAGVLVPVIFFLTVGAGVPGENTMARLLLEHKADVSSETNDGMTSLHAAAQAGVEGVVRLLLDNGADLAAKTHAGATAEDLATAGAHPHIAAMLRAEAMRLLRRAQRVALGPSRGDGDAGGGGPSGVQRKSGGGRGHGTEGAAGEGFAGAGA